MTTEQRRQFYWDMYFVAEGLKQMTFKEIREYNKSAVYTLPDGFCIMIFGHDCFYIHKQLSCLLEIQNNYPELHKQKPDTGNDFWFRASHWKIRQAAILKAIKLTYND